MMKVGRIHVVGVVVVVIAGIVPLFVGAQAAAAPRCPAVSVTTAAESPGVAGWAENLTFDDDGNLWVSRVLDNTVERFDRAGRRTAAVHVVAPGAIRTGPDGLLYIASGDTTLNMVPGSPRTGTIVRLDPSRPRPAVQVFATGLGMPNGMDFDAAGMHYVADGNFGVLRIDRRGAIDTAWSRRAPKNLAVSRTVNGTSTNGIVVLGDSLYVTLTMSLTGRILRVPIGDPGAVSVAADVTRPFPGVLDDLVALDGRTLAVTMTTGQIATVDLPTHGVCVAGIGQPVTAIAQRPGRPDLLIVGTESGALRAVAVRH
ncbi:SMP-30/gluconolactonase/LRE family protein [Gordonia sp. DT101]|uniref:SMP-30/gluconolactonase/LRE family protein n=1 Tax=Gordonia sp. DT101 TaxID=3416545 RepID=UPI003CE68A23